MVVEDYDQIDGPHSGASDAKGLSLGLAQWNERRNIEISAKVWRHTGERWSRQSEELPLHRVLDLAILILEAKKFIMEFPENGNSKIADFPNVGSMKQNGDELPVAININNPMIDEDLEIFREFWNSELIDSRLMEIAERLRGLGLKDSFSVNT